MIKPLLEQSDTKPTLKTSQSKVTLLRQLFEEEILSCQVLVEQGFHLHLQHIIVSDTYISTRKSAAKVYGATVIQLVKLKKYREVLYEYLTKLRLSKNFRDRQMYVKIAKSALKID